MAAWWRGAKRNPMPHSSMQAATPSGDSSTSTPSAPSTSALPHFDETARFPCLATRAPPAAATNAAAVEMLNECEPSPPVPQVSMSRSCDTSTPTARERRACDEQGTGAGARRGGSRGEEKAALVDDPVGVAGRGRLAGHPPRAEGLADALVAGAHAEERDWPARLVEAVQAASARDQLQAHAGLVGRARAGREHQALGIAREDFFCAERIVAQHFHLGAQLAQPLHQVEGERVVIVDDEDLAQLHRSTATPAARGALFWPATAP